MPGLSWIKAAPWLVTGAVLVTILGGLWLHGRAAGVAVERPKVEAARDDAAARGLEAQGERDSAARVEAFQGRVGAARETVTRLERDLQDTDDAEDPMDPVRADRLRAHDRELCRLAPQLEGCAKLAGD